MQAYPEGVLSDKFKFNKKRVRTLSGNDGFLAREAKGVVYYMHRDQRVQDNWALIYAQRLAYQVSPLPQFYSVDFLLTGIRVKKKHNQVLHLLFLTMSWDIRAWPSIPDGVYLVSLEFRKQHMKQVEGP